MDLNPKARIPELGEYVQMGKYATAFRGVKGQVIRVEPHRFPKKDPLGNENGHDATDLYIATAFTHNGKRVVIRASPYELDGALD